MNRSISVCTFVAIHAAVKGQARKTEPEPHLPQRVAILGEDNRGFVDSSQQASQSVDLGFVFRSSSGGVENRAEKPSLLGRVVEGDECRPHRRVVRSGELAVYRPAEGEADSPERRRSRARPACVRSTTATSGCSTTRACAARTGPANTRVRAPGFEADPGRRAKNAAAARASMPRPGSSVCADDGRGACRRRERRDVTGETAAGGLRRPRRYRTTTRSLYDSRYGVSRWRARHTAFVRPARRRRRGARCQWQRRGPRRPRRRPIGMRRRPRECLLV